jgi:Flp pilus assembly protein protease CpaA
VQGETITGLLEPKPGPAPSAHSGLQLWLHRTSVFLFVLISAVAGVLLVILPWTPEWTDNSLLLSYPWLRMLVSTGFFRGLCSGLGLLDIWIGFWEALHYHDRQ